MALINFIITVTAVSAAVVLLRSDVRKSAAIFRSNMRHIRNWLEEESATASKSAEGITPKELDHKVSTKDSSKEDKA